MDWLNGPRMLIGMEVLHVESLDAWASWRQQQANGGQRWLLGTGAWHAFLWHYARQAMLETDPGPLDARLP